MLVICWALGLPFRAAPLPGLFMLVYFRLLRGLAAD